MTAILRTAGEWFVPAIIFLGQAVTLTEGIAWAWRRIRRQREAWPPRRVITTRDTLEETF